MLVVGKSYKVELMQEAYRSCRDKPSAKLLLAILAMDSGDVVEIVGEEYFYSSDKGRFILEESGLRVSVFESDGVYYRIVAVK